VSDGRVRHEWVGERRTLLGAVAEEPATLGDFAGSDTTALLAAEPRLVDVAELVVGCARAGGVPDEMWPGVERIVAALVGPRRSATMTTPLNAASMVVASALAGETTRRRYVEALRARAAEETEAWR
jgi:hypothetical protein